jgi:hypothetical protein
MKTKNVVILTLVEWADIQDDLATLQELRNQDCYTINEIEVGQTKLIADREKLSEIADNLFHDKELLIEEEASFKMRKHYLDSAIRQFNLRLASWRLDLDELPWWIRWFIPEYNINTYKFKKYDEDFRNKI